MVLFILPVPVHAGLAEDILSQHERWDQHSIAGFGDTYHYRICQKDILCYDARLTFQGESEKGQHWDVTIVDRLGHQVPGELRPETLGLVTGDVEADSKQIRYVWGEANIIPEIRTFRASVPPPEPDETPMDSFLLIMDGTLSMGNSPKYHENQNIQILDDAFAYFADHDTRPLPQITDMERGDRFNYMICVDGSPCMEYSLTYDGADALGLHFLGVVYDREWYDRSLLGGQKEFTALGGGPVGRYGSLETNPASWTSTPIPQEKILGGIPHPGSCNEKCRYHKQAGDPTTGLTFEIIIDDKWTLRESTSYHTNPYMASLESTLLLLGGSIRIGDGTMMEYEPVLETGESWNDRSGFGLVVTGIMEDYNYGGMGIRERMHVVGYSTTKPVANFVISQDVPFPVSGTYTGGIEELSGDPITPSKYWFRMLIPATEGTIDDSGIGELLASLDLTIIEETDDVEDTDSAEDTGTDSIQIPVGQINPNDGITPSDELNEIIDGAIDGALEGLEDAAEQVEEVVNDVVDGTTEYVDNIVDGINMIFQDDTDTHIETGVIGRESKLFIFDDMVLVDVELGTSGIHTVSIPRYMLNTADWPPLFTVELNGNEAGYTYADQGDALYVELHLPTRPSIIHIIPEGGIGCGGTGECIRTTLSEVTDGNTIKTEDGLPVRLSLVSAPEIDGRGTGLAAKNVILDACPIGSDIMIDEDDLQSDGSFGRMVAKVTCNGIVLNEHLLETHPESHIIAEFCGGSEFSEEVWARTHGC